MSSYIFEHVTHGLRTNMWTVTLTKSLFSKTKQKCFRLKTEQKNYGDLIYFSQALKYAFY